MFLMLRICILFLLLNELFYSCFFYFQLLMSSPFYYLNSVCDICFKNTSSELIECSQYSFFFYKNCFLSLILKMYPLQSCILLQPSNDCFELYCAFQLQCHFDFFYPSHYFLSPYPVILLPYTSSETISLFMFFNFLIKYE